MKLTNKFVIVVVLAMLTQSCATIFSGTKTRVSVAGAPEAANVYYNGSFVGEAPCRVKVSKNSLKGGNTKVQIKKESYETAEVTLARKIKMGAFIFNFFVFPVGHIVDFATGAIYKPYPNKIEYRLEKNNYKLKKT